MKYKVDGWNNFCQVFELPDEYPKGFCFGGGHRTIFLMVDWFYPVEDIFQIIVSKKVYKKEVGEIPIAEIDGEQLSERLISFIRKKDYVKDNKKYLVICDFGLTFMFEKELKQ